MKKKLMFPKLMGFLGVLMFAFFMFPAISFAGTEANVTADSAYLRSEASSGSKALGSVVKGDKLDVISKETDTAGNTWYKVYVDANTTGFIRSDLVSVSGDVATSQNSNTNTNTNTNTDTNTSTSTGNTQTVDTSVTIDETGMTETEPMTASVKGTVNVRAKASTSGKKVTSAKQGTAVTVTGYAQDSENKTWYRINYQDGNTPVNGFIRNDFISLDGELIDKVVAPPEEETTEEEPEEEETPEPVYKDYEAVFEQSEETWYLYNYIEGKKTKIDDLNAAVGKIAEEEAEKTALKGKITLRNVIIIILSALIVVLIGVGVYAYINFRQWYYGYGETEEPVKTRETEKSYRQERKPSSYSSREVQPVRPTASNVKAQTIGAPERKSGLPEGAVKLSDGRVQMPDGSIRKVVTGVRMADGSVKLSDGRVQMPDGTMKYPDGSMKTPDGRIIRPENASDYQRAGSSMQEVREIPVRKTAKLTQDDDDMEFGFLNLDDMRDED
ncbi:MAG: SH3 domain-containing protein [Lachnospiraceae bacterium]|nr:SH3 domain-containing protein [Lachnospiraceae bacterium]